MNRQVDSYYPEGAIDLRSLVDIIWLKRWWVATSVFIFTAGFTSVAFMTTPVYRAATVLISASSDRSSLSGSLSSALGQLGGLASLAGVGVGGGDAATEESLAVLRSRSFTERFITELNLLPALYPKLWDREHNKWLVDAKHTPTLARAYRQFNSQIRAVIQDKKTGLITLQIDWTNREQASQWANELVRRLNEEMRSRAIATTEASIRYLERELDTTSEVATREAVNKLMLAQVKQRMLANVTPEYSFRVVDRAQTPDEDDPIKPKKIKMIASGLLVGMLAGILLVVVAGALARRPPSVVAED